MLRAVLSASLLLLLWLSAPAVRAEGPTGGRLDEPSGEDDFIASTERDEDPLAFDDATDRALRRAADAHHEAEERARWRRVRVVTGQALSAASGVHEQAHEVALRWSAGLMHIETRMRFATRGSRSAEIAYRLPLPEGAVVSLIEVCSRERCQRAKARSDAQQAYLEALASRPPRLGAPPIASGSIIRDDRGRALSLRAAPVTAEAPITIRVRYVCAAPVVGGDVRFLLPARGRDPRAAPATLTVAAEDLQVREPSNDRRRVLPWLPLTFDASLPATARSRTTVSCGVATRCLRRWEAHPLDQPPRLDLLVWLDGSPSMEGPARGRLPIALLSLLESVDPTSRVWPTVFAAHARALPSALAWRLSLRELAHVLQEALGNSTRLGPAWRSARDARAASAGTNRRLVLLSDGRVGAEPDNLQVLERARREGLPVWLLTLDEHAPPASLIQALTQTGGGWLPLAREADWAERAGRTAALRAALSKILRGRGDGGLTPGEQRVVERRDRGVTPRPRGDRERDLAAWALRRAAPTGWLALSSGDTARPPARLAMSEPFLSHSAPRVAAAATGLPRESVLHMLRTQLTPAARRCLRTDRKGRANYAVSLSFRLTLERREVNAAVVEGDIPAPLRRCLTALLPQLTVPMFSGRVLVRYPIHTQRRVPPPTIELEPEVARVVDGALRRLRRPPPPHAPH